MRRIVKTPQVELRTTATILVPYEPEAEGEEFKDVPVDGLVASA
jgi:hypothetical protein